MRPVSVFADDPDCKIEQLEAICLAAGVMVLLSLQGLPPAQNAGLLACHPAMVC